MYSNWTETRIQMDQVLEVERTMNRQQRRRRWQQVTGICKHLYQAILAPFHQATTAPQIVQPDDTYFLAGGAYRLRVLTGELWIPEAGIYSAGERIDLQVAAQGVGLRPAAAQPIAFTLSPADASGMGKI